MSDERKGKPTESIEFYAGLVLLAIGLYFILSRAHVSSWGGISFGGYSIPSGLVVIPLILGVIWMFYNPKSIVARIISILGGIIIVASIIMSTRISFSVTSLFDYLVMVGLSAAGTGLLLKAFFSKNK